MRKQDSVPRVEELSTKKFDKNFEQDQMKFIPPSEPTKVNTAVIYSQQKSTHSASRPSIDLHASSNLPINPVLAQNSHVKNSHVTPEKSFLLQDN